MIARVGDSIPPRAVGGVFVLKRQSLRVIGGKNAAMLAGGHGEQPSFFLFPEFTIDDHVIGAFGRFFGQRL